MTNSNYLLPRLDAPHAMELLEELRSTPPTSVDSSGAAVTLGAATFRETGGMTIEMGQFNKLRHAVDEARSMEMRPGKLESDFDRLVGRALVEHLPISRAEAGVHDVWRFIGLAVLPSASAARFSLDKVDRHVTDFRRHPLRRAWAARMILGEDWDGKLLDLNQDQIGQIIERPFLASDHRLARAMARQMIAWGSSNSPKGKFQDEEGPNIRGASRQFATKVYALTGSMALSMLNDQELHEILEVAASESMA